MPDQNPEQMPHHDSKRVQILVILAVIILVVIALIVLRERSLDGANEVVGEATATAADTDGVPPPSDAEIAAHSILQGDQKAAFEAIQAKVNSGELTPQEAEAEMEKLTEKLAIPQN